MSIRKKKYRMMGMAVGLALTACTADDAALRLEETGGNLRLTLSDATAAETRTLPDGLMLTDAEGHLTDDIAAGFTVHLSMPDSTYSRDVPATERTIRLPLGRFVAATAYGDNALLAWDAPYYTGSTEFRITHAGEQVSVDIPCRMQNALADFTSDDFGLLDAMLTDYAVRMTVTDDRQSDSLDWKPEFSTHPYVKAGARITCCLVGTRADGSVIRVPFGEEVIAKAATRHCYALHFQSDNGTTDGLQLGVDRSDMPVTLTESVPVTWLPGPTITAISSDASDYRFETGAPSAVTDEMNYVETQQGDLSFDIRSLRAATDITLQTASLGTLPDATYHLLAPSAEEQAAWEASGLTFISDEDGLHHTLDLSALINRLESEADGTTVHSQLQLSVTANGRTTTHTYLIHTEAPEFTLELDDRHIWTKTLTLGTLHVTRGNAEELRRRLSFRYQASDASETTLTEKGALEVQWGESQAGKTCDVTAVYRDKDILQKTLAFETPQQIPNADFEEWTDDSYSSYSTTYWTFNPWNANTLTGCHWDTNNSWTTRHRWNAKGFRYDYNGLHAVSYVAGRDNAGLAAELRSTANGRGNLAGSRKEWNKVAGQLFTGTFTAIKKGNDTNGSDDFRIDKDADFPSRPTGLSFWYQYIPFTNSDHPQDYWRATLHLLDAEGNTILTQSVSDCNAQAEWKQGFIRLDVDREVAYAKCSKIFVEFISTIYGYNLDKYDEGNAVYTGNDMPYQETGIVYWTGSTIDDAHKKERGTAYVGSILRIDDVTLIYDR